MVQALKALAALIVALPEILRLISSIQKRIEEEEIRRKVAEDLKKINEAFENRDEKALRDIFKS